MYQKGIGQAIGIVRAMPINGSRSIGLVEVEV